MSDYTNLRNINRGYMKLDAWKKGMELFQLVWNIVHRDATIDFKLRSQISDAAQSVSSNIAEGYSRRSIKEYIQFLYFILGSLSEVLTRSIGLTTTRQISEAQFQQIDSLHYGVENKLVRLVESLQKKKEEGTWSDRISEDIADFNP